MPTIKRHQSTSQLLVWYTLLRVSISRENLDRLKPNLIFLAMAASDAVARFIAFDVLISVGWDWHLQRRVWICVAHQLIASMTWVSLSKSFRTRRGWIQTALPVSLQDAFLSDIYKVSQGSKKRYLLRPSMTHTSPMFWHDCGYLRYVVRTLLTILYSYSPMYLPALHL